MPHNAQESAMMICYCEYLSNLKKFNGSEEKKVVQFVNHIERIRKVIYAKDAILYCMCTAKLDGEAKRWYEDNMSLNQWEHLKSALLERFTTSDLSSRIFEQLKERKQKSDESITACYDTIIKLCHEYDPSISQKMMLSWLENDAKDSLKIPLKRQIKLLTEGTRTIRTFLKLAKGEQELQTEHCSELESAQLYPPYFANTVLITLQQTANEHSNRAHHSRPPPTTTSYQSRTRYQQ
jgi:hypothetical protein